MKKYISKQFQKGSSLITVLVFSVVAISIATTAVAIMINLSQATMRIEGNVIAKQTAESGIENALLRLLRDPSYTGETLMVGNGSVAITVTGSSTKTITSVATINSHTKTIQVVATFTDGIMTVTSWNEI